MLDIGDLPAEQAKRIIASWWYRIRRVVENTPTAFVVIAAESCVRSAAALILRLENEAALWSCVVSAKLEKNNMPAEPQIQIQDGVIRLCFGASIVVANQSGSAHTLIPTSLLQGTSVKAQQQKPVGFASAEFKPGFNWAVTRSA